MTTRLLAALSLCAACGDTGSHGDPDFTPDVCNAVAQTGWRILTQAVAPDVSRDTNDRDPWSTRLEPDLLA